MLPLRYDILSFGGSWAQRQVFSITMIQAAVKSNKISLALALVAELKVSNQIKLCITVMEYIHAVILSLKAQKPKSKRLKQLLDELKSTYDVQKNSLSDNN